VVAISFVALGSGRQLISHRINERTRLLLRERQWAINDIQSTCRRRSDSDYMCVYTGRGSERNCRRYAMVEVWNQEKGREKSDIKSLYPPRVDLTPGRDGYRK
jgi:hypothetical protein